MVCEKSKAEEEELARLEEIYKKSLNQSWHSECKKCPHKEECKKIARINNPPHKKEVKNAYKKPK